ncbi:hypothetical protein QQF64_001144 [Cirrhinus molitorella]|uniref:Uncharacterized protein n=1 Tax=Cirrhinus molitorella TaxID=172907 RepID=A0ABR3NZE4_9TELE
MEKNFNEQLLELREQSKQSSCMIASLAKAVQYNADEVKDCKGKISELEKCNERLCKENKELKERIRVVSENKRVGRKDDNRKRHIVVSFVRRQLKEEMWRRCKEKGIRLAEMLPLEDREARKQLWPQIEQTRREGKQAYFRRPHGYIEGRRIG